MKKSSEIKQASNQTYGEFHHYIKLRVFRQLARLLNSERAKSSSEIFDFPFFEWFYWGSVCLLPTEFFLIFWFLVEDVELLMYGGNLT